MPPRACTLILLLATFTITCSDKSHCLSFVNACKFDVRRHEKITCDSGNPPQDGHLSKIDTLGPFIGGKIRREQLVQVVRVLFLFLTRFHVNVACSNGNPTWCAKN